MAGTHATLGPVVVREFSCAEYVCQGRIVYRPSPEVVGFYEHHLWATDPRELITQHVADALQSSGIFQTVETHARSVQPAYLLTGRIDRLEEIDEGRNVQAFCALSAKLIDARSGAVLWIDTASATRPVELRSVTGVVKSLSTAVQSAVDDLMRSMTKQLGGNRLSKDDRNGQ
jgi:ABC-type uncharacterized transport system auxiliary subunit